MVHTVSWKKKQYFKQYKVLLGMVGNKVERLKFIGRREMDMNANIKSVFDESDENYYKPYFNDAKELFWTDDDFSQG